MNRGVWKLLIFLLCTHLSANSDFDKKFTFNDTEIKIKQFSKVATNGVSNMENLFYSVEILVGNTVIKKESIISKTGIQNAGINDLDKDGDVEIYIYWKSEGTGIYAMLHYFELRGYDLVALTIPDPNINVKKMFRGKDKITIGDEKITHKYPAYSDIDPNCCPSVGEVELTYILQNDMFYEIGYNLVPKSDTRKSDKTTTLIIKQITGLPNMDGLSPTDCWLKIQDGDGDIFTTDRVRNNNSPQFNLRFKISPKDNLSIIAYDKDVSKDEFIGSTNIVKLESGLYPLLRESANGSVETVGQVELEIIR